MRLVNTTAMDDKILSTCEDFGGVAQECVEIAERLDGELTEALQRIEKLERDLAEAEERK